MLGRQKHPLGPDDSGLAFHSRLNLHLMPVKQLDRFVAQGIAQIMQAFYVQYLGERRYSAEPARHRDQLIGGAEGSKRRGDGYERQIPKLGRLTHLHLEAESFQQIAEGRDLGKKLTY